MKKIGICCLGLLFSLCSYAQVQREYHLISAEKIENKAYYFTALLREFGEVDSMICHDPVLKKMGLKKLERFFSYYLFKDFSFEYKNMHFSSLHHF